MRQQLGLIAICTALVLLGSLAIGLVYRTLPPQLAIAIIVMPSVVGACAGGLSWQTAQENKRQHAKLTKDVAVLSENVNFRLTQLLVATADEQRAQGKAEGVASVTSDVDQAALASAKAATHAAELVAIAVESAKVVVETAAQAAESLLETTKAAAQVQTNTESIQAIQWHIQTSNDMAANTAEVARNTASNEVNTEVTKTLSDKFTKP